MSDRAALLQPVDGRDRGIRGGQYRGNHDHQPLVQIARRLEEILHRDERLRFAVEADMGDARVRHQIEHAFGESDAGPQHRREHQFLAGDLRRLHAGKRGLDLDVGQRQIAGDLVAQQHPDLLEELAKRFGRDAFFRESASACAAPAGGVTIVYAVHD